MQANYSINYIWWYRVGLFNLLLVASIGVLLRLKLVASLPWLNHKYWLHGHSHFAFNGWISLVLMTTFISMIYPNQIPHKSRLTFKWLLISQLIAAYGMLISFPIYGYGTLSIFFSSSSIAISSIFSLVLLQNLKKTNFQKTILLSIKSALTFLVLSSLGTFSLAFLMATHSGNQSLYFGALYFFLHFQYNGWFLFGILSIFLFQLQKMNIILPQIAYQTIKILALACMPAFLLSLLWIKLPVFLYILACIAGILQVLPFFLYQKKLSDLIRLGFTNLSGITKWLWKISFAALGIKLLMQLLSTLPWLSKYAFAYRPVVIAYLHLILLGMITCFLLGYLANLIAFIPVKTFFTRGSVIFLLGLFVTESALFLQGLGYMGWVSIPYIQPALLVAAILMAAGFAVINTGFLFRKTQSGV